MKCKKYITPVILIMVVLTMCSCDKKKSEKVLPQLIGKINSGNIKVTNSGIVTMQMGPEIYIWKNAVAQETEKLVAAGYTNLDEVCRLVSKQTQALEENARKMYVGSQMMMFALARDETKELSDPQIKSTMDESSENIEAEIKKIMNEQFRVKKNKLIEERFTEAIAAQ